MTYIKTDEMKRFVLLSVVLFLIGASVLRAQEDKIGIRAGYQNSNLVSDGDKVGDGLSGYYVGIFKDHKLIPLLRLSTGLEFSQMGCKAKDGAFDGDNLHINYLSIPIGVKAKVGPFFGTVGSGINIKVGESDKFDKLDYDVNTIDVPIYAGAGFNFLFLGIEGRYIWGMTDIDKDTKNRVFQIGLTARF